MNKFKLQLLPKDIIIYILFPYLDKFELLKTNKFFYKLKNHFCLKKFCFLF